MPLELLLPSSAGMYLHITSIFPEYAFDFKSDRFLGNAKERTAELFGEEAEEEEGRELLGKFMEGMGKGAGLDEAVDKVFKERLERKGGEGEQARLAAQARAGLRWTEGGEDEQARLAAQL